MSPWKFNQLVVRGFQIPGPFVPHCTYRTYRQNGCTDFTDARTVRMYGLYGCTDVQINFRAVHNVRASKIAIVTTFICDNRLASDSPSNRSSIRNLGARLFDLWIDNSCREIGSCFTEVVRHNSCHQSWH